MKDKIDEILEILQKRVTNAFNDCGNSYSVIDAEEDDLKELTAELSSLMRTDLWKELIEFSTAIFDISTDYLGKPIDKIVDEYLQSRPNSKAVTDEEIEKKAIEEGRNQYDLNEGLKMNAFIKGYSKGAKAMRDGLITK